MSIEVEEIKAVRAAPSRKEILQEARKILMEHGCPLFAFTVAKEIESKFNIQLRSQRLSMLVKTSGLDFDVGRRLASLEEIREQYGYSYDHSRSFVIYPILRAMEQNGINHRKGDENEPK